MPYKLAIFDFDGTLADSFAWFMRVVNDAAAVFAFKTIAPDETDLLRGKSAREMVAHVGVPMWKMPLIASYMRRRKAQDLTSIRPFDGATAMLRDVHAAGVTLAVVNSNSEANVRGILGTEPAALISHYECGVSLFGKAARFKNVLRRSGCGRAETIAIGDEIRDIEAARQAGIAFGAVSWGYTLPEALTQERPEQMFRSFEDIRRELTASGRQ
jgi:phosphoglycolate phosphatase